MPSSRSRHPLAAGEGVMVHTSRSAARRLHLQHTKIRITSPTPARSVASLGASQQWRKGWGGARLSTSRQLTRATHASLQSLCARQGMPDHGVSRAAPSPNRRARPQCACARSHSSHVTLISHACTSDSNPPPRKPLQPDTHQLTGVQFSVAGMSCHTARRRQVDGSERSSPLPLPVHNPL